MDPAGLDWIVDAWSLLGLALHLDVTETEDKKLLIGHSHDTTENQNKTSKQYEFSV